MVKKKTKKKHKNEQELFDEADRLFAEFLRKIREERKSAIDGFFNADFEKLPHEYVEEYLISCIAANDAFIKAIDLSSNEKHLDKEFPELKKHITKKENKYILMSNTLHALKTAIENQDVARVAVMGVWLGDQFAEDRMDKGSDLRLMQLRQKGLDKRKLNAKKSHELIKTSLNDLYRQGEGYKKTYPQIAKFLLDRHLSSYAENTTLKLVKKYAPAIKKKYLK